VKSFTSRTARLSAVLSGGAREVGADEAHARNVLIITGKIHKKRARLRALVAEVKRLRRELRRDRHELRLVLQRDSTIRTEDDPALQAGGRADAIDAVQARGERGK
jgi:hypothetical protein